ncbi:actin-crosslinking protein [Xylona heveae TC161]|uniref:Actin-crosslinking protein n=1 Tax=Xylona heveae (strain CBS 132557 / TC161) TaxID=1328760 RepID=A0A165GD36_XYLHT|nr:actin-crosslinking protein [Xylona heveae TC161]KZF22045.1 actin-crosslinking protein [Xylona heveae TC161]
MVKPLTFKGDKPKKRKRTIAADDSAQGPSKELVTESSSAVAADDDDSWVTAEAPGDIAGPVIFTLPTSPATCLACDANGKVFASVLENIIDGNPATAEPHDVRQVWRANAVAGSGTWTFKGHHGKYLGCDKFGVFSATKEAVSPEEAFNCIPVPDAAGMMSLQTQRDTFLTVNEEGKSGPEIRGDGETINFSSTLRIRMQARFKPRLKANKEEKAKEKISRKELEEAVGRRLNEDDVRRLKRARREGDYHEAILDVRAKGKHDKFA